MASHRDRDSGQIGQGPAVGTMAAGGRRRTGGTDGGGHGHLHDQGQALVFDGEGLHWSGGGRRRAERSVHNRGVLLS